MRLFPGSMWQLLAAAAFCAASPASAVTPAEAGHRLAQAVTPHVAAPAAMAGRGVAGTTDSRPNPENAAAGPKAVAEPAGSQGSDGDAETADLTHRAALVLAAVAAIGFVRRRLRR